MSSWTENPNGPNKQLSLRPTFAQQAAPYSSPLDNLSSLSAQGNSAAKDDYSRKCLLVTWLPLSSFLLESVVWHKALNFFFFFFVLNSFPRNVKYHQGHREWDTLFAVLCSESLLFIHKCVISSAGSPNQGTLNRRAECRSCLLPTQLPPVLSSLWK